MVLKYLIPIEAVALAAVVFINAVIVRCYDNFLIDGVDVFMNFGMFVFAKLIVDEMVEVAILNASAQYLCGIKIARLIN